MLLCIGPISFEICYRFGKHIVGGLRVRLWFMRLDRSYNSLVGHNIRDGFTYPMSVCR